MRKDGSVAMGIKGLMMGRKRGKGALGMRFWCFGCCGYCSRANYPLYPL